MCVDLRGNTAFEYELNKVQCINDQKSFSKLFDEELEAFSKGKLPADHVFRLGFPGIILLNAGFPAEKEIQLKASILNSKENRHLFDANDLKGLVDSIADPIAVFTYWDDKGRNIIVDITQGDNNYLVGVQFVDNEGNQLEISSIRTIFPKNTANWLHWFEQGKGVYVNKKKLHSLITQQRTNLADVDHLDMESIDRIISKTSAVNVSG